MGERSDGHARQAYGVSCARWRRTSPEQRQVRRGREARQAARLARAVETLPYLTRKLAPVEVISTEGLEQIEHNADTLLEQVGIEIVNYPEAVEIFRAAGADVEGAAGPLPARDVPLARSRPAPRGSSPSAPATRRGASSSAIRTSSSSRPTARRSSTTSTTAGATRRSRTSATS